ncbi:MAG: alpha/beta hydrolase [Acidobacteriota bacterium]
MASQDMQAVRDLLASFPDSSSLSLAELRAVYDQMGQSFPLPAEVTLQPVEVNGVKAEWVKADLATEAKTVLYVHGGGYIIGSTNSHRHQVAAISQATGASVLSLNYRLAPENPHPAAVEDSVAAYRCLLEQGIEANNIMIAGDSAGGGLTIATLVALREQGIELPAGGICISPWVDLTNSAESILTKAEADPICTETILIQMATAYLQGQDAKTPLASPLYADLQGLPPLLIQVGTEEILLDDSLNLEKRAKEAGVPVTLEIWEDMVHVWHFFHPMLKEGREAINRIGDFYKTHTA